MTKKTYRPTLFLSIMIPIMFVLIGLYLYCIFSYDNAFLWIRVFCVCIYIIVVLVLAYLLIQIAVRQRIELRNDEIFVPQNSFIKRLAYQFEVHIPYADIADISCTYSTMTSKKTPDPNRPRSPRKWAVITLKNGKTKRFSLGYYTPNHSARILDDIISRCAEVGNAINVLCGEVIVANRRKVASKNKSKE